MYGRLHIFFVLLFVFLLASCGDDDHFEVSGTIEGSPTFNMRFHYYGDGALHTGITASREGKFLFRGSSSQPVMVDIYDNDYRLMGRLYARNGDEIECVLDPGNPYKSTFKGNEVNRRWTSFINANADVLYRPGRDANRLIADYVAENKSDIVSTMLLTGSYDASRDMAAADSLLQMLAPEARPANFVEGYEYLLQRVAGKDAMQPVLPMTFADSRDSLCTFNPRRSRMNLIVVSNRGSGRQDSIVSELRRLRKAYSDSNLSIVDFSTDADTALWKQSISRDSATWLQGWGAGSLAAPAIRRLGVPSVPYFIVADSTGRQIYRGFSLRQAVATVGKK